MVFASSTGFVHPTLLPCVTYSTWRICCGVGVLRSPNSKAGESAANPENQHCATMKGCLYSTIRYKPFKIGCNVRLLGVSRQTFPSRDLLYGDRSYASVSAADLQFGQPVHETHPHLLKAGESKYSINWNGDKL